MTRFIAKITVLSLITCVFFSSFLVSATSDTFNIRSIVDYKTRVVEVTVAISQPQANVPVTIVILFPSKSIGDIDINNTHESSKGAICHMDTKQTDSSGKVIFNYTLKSDAPTGYYSVVCGVNNYSGTKQSQAYYFSAETVKQVLETCNLAISSASVANIKTAISTYYRELQIEEVYSIYDNPTFAVNKDIVANLIISHGVFSNLTDIKNLFEEVVAVNCVNNANKENVMDVIIANNNKIGMNLSLYNSLTNAKDIDFIKTVMKKSVYSSSTEINDAYTAAIALINVNNATWDTVWGVILANNALVKVPSSVIEKYNNLTNKERVNQELVTIISVTPFYNYADLVTAFTAAVDKENLTEQSQQIGTDNGTTTSNIKIGGGGSGGYSGGIVPVAEEINPKTLNGFNDIDSVQWAIESIKYLSEKQIINGNGNGAFLPNDYVTREQFIKMLVIGFGFEDSSASATFTDVDKNEWYYNYVASAQKIGITKGMEDGSFGVGSEITREQMASMAYRAAELSGKVTFDVSGATGFKDDKQISDYAKDGIVAMKNAGIINGMEDGSFEPNANANRAQAAKIIYGLLKMQK